MVCQMLYILTKEPKMVKDKKNIMKTKELLMVLQKKIMIFLCLNLLLQTTAAIPLFLI